MKQKIRIGLLNIILVPIVLTYSAQAAAYNWSVLWTHITSLVNAKKVSQEAGMEYRRERNIDLDLDRKTIEAFYNKRPIGYITYGAINTLDPRMRNNQCRIGLIKVSNQHRRNGIGKELVRLALEDMKHCYEVDLSASNPGSIAFFSALGAEIKNNAGSAADMLFINKEQKAAREQIDNLFSTYR